MIQGTIIRLFVALMLIFHADVDVDAQVKISPLFTDHALIQQGKILEVWGAGTEDEIVTVSFQDLEKSTKVDSEGHWRMKLGVPTSGGPYILKVNDQVYQDIYVGDLWLAGGQSNMEWKMGSSDGFSAEKVAEIPRIHYFKTPHQIHNRAQWDVAGGEWIVVDSSNLADVSAVGYFFAKNIAEVTRIPIGILDHSWGGTDIEGWMSPKSFTGLPDIQEAADEALAKDIDFEKQQAELIQWYEGMDQADEGLQNDWITRTDFSSWTAATVPGKWENAGYKGLDGIVYYTRKFSKPTVSADVCYLHLGQIDDSDETYINGSLVGSMQNAYNKDRRYSIPYESLAEENTIIVRIRDNGGGGGFSSSPESIYLECGDDVVQLAGPWKMKIGTKDYPQKPMLLGPNSFPSNRYNAIVHPLEKLKISGMIWYQGESNTGKPEQYGQLFTNMINDYRARWNDDFPFLYVQLANYGEVSGPERSNWASLRDQQALALELPRTAMATAIDLGEAYDIHPRNKKDVGLRLAAGALSIAYKLPRPYKNPVLSSSAKSDSIILLGLDNVGLKLRARSATLNAFYIEDGNGAYQQVDASLVGNQVQVVVPKDTEFLYYAWSDNPGALSLYGSYGLPVLPFRIKIE